MTLETNFNAAPYFDDFNVDKNFHRILFRPGVAVQARELTQLQTILQDQIDKFGRHIFKDGSIVEGCAIDFDDNYNYVKLNDTYANGTPITISDLIGNKVVSAANLQAQIVNVISGLESNAPDLNTIYVKYLNSALYANGSPKTTFDPDEIIEIRTTNDTNIANVVIANLSFNSIGTGYAVFVSDGVIFNKGHFVDIKPQTAIVSKYDSFPFNVSVGFYTTESVITVDSDLSLADNALGSSNLSAPGANRLKLSANLVIRNSESISNTDSFFSIVDFNAGRSITRITNPQYANLGDEIARRTFEESGNYIVSPFELSTSANNTVANNLVIEVGSGIGYVQGYRVEIIDTAKYNMRRGTNFSYFPNQIITANYGNYIVVNEYAGIFDIKNLTAVNLHASAATKLTSGDYTTAGSAPANLIGTARIRTVEHDSGIPGTPLCQYRVYLFDIRITEGGFNFSDVRSLYAQDLAGVAGYADSVLVGGETVLRESAKPDVVFDIGRKAIKTINSTSTSFIYKNSQSISFQTTGQATMVPATSHPGGSDTIAVTGSLSEQNELRFIVVPTVSANGANISGVTVSVNTTSADVSSGNTFTNNFSVGDYIAVGNSAGTWANNIRRVVSITNTTHMVVNSNFSDSNSAFDIARHFPAGVSISFAREDSANVVVLSDGSSATFNIGTSLTSTMSSVVYYDVLRSQANQARKAINKNRFVKIQANTHPLGTTGPWCLGLSDANRIRSVYQGSTFSTSNPNLSRFFKLDDGQRGGSYNLAELSILPNSGHSIGPNDSLLIELDHFTPDYSQGIGYFSVDSYPIDDVNTSNTTAIQTASIPRFISEVGITYDLRDVIDFRVYSINTANSSTTEAGASINPNPNTSLFIDASGAHSPTVDQNFNTAFSFYLGRKDKISLSRDGDVQSVEGAPGNNPAAPRDIDGNMTLGIVSIPPYPSLSQSEARLFGRTDYSTDITLQQNRRYTMRDIGVIDKKVSRLEYYTSLSLLETSAKTLTPERFKNGFIVDPFKGFTISDTESPEFKAAIDFKLQELAPTIKRTYVDLDIDFSGGFNIVKEGNLVLLTGNSAPYIDQPFSSKTRNCVENIIYVWSGNIELTPEGDHQPDIDVRPDVVGNIDLSGLTNFINAFPNIIGPERIIATTALSSRDGTIQRNISNNSGTFTVTDTTRDVVATTTTTTLKSDLSVSAATIDTGFNFGDLVQDVSIQPFIRSRRVFFKTSNLKPSTFLFAHFDGQPVSAFCTPTNSSYVPIGSRGAALFSDPDGIVYGYFDIPAETFKVGERVFRICDSDDLNINPTVTTQAAATYVASNITITKSRFEVRTRHPQVAINTLDTVLGKIISERVDSSSVLSTTTDRIAPPSPPPLPDSSGVDYSPPSPSLQLTSREWLTTDQGRTLVATFNDGSRLVEYTDQRPDARWDALRLDPTLTRSQFSAIAQASVARGIAPPTFCPNVHDPICQTFLVNESGIDSSVFIKKIDLYFRSKHPVLGVELQIREVSNGFPTLKIVPFGRKTLPTSSVQISNDASAVTEFVFDTPVLLQAGKEYCFVVIPVGANDGYNIWVGEIGSTDITTGSPIYINNSTGVLFTSSTNRVWTPFQREDIKFTIHRRTFSSLNGLVKYTNANTEYLTANNFAGDFIIGEKIFASNPTVLISSNAVCNTTSTTVSVVANGSSNALSLFTNGQLIYVSSNSAAFTDIRQVIGITNATHITVNTALSFNDSNSSVGSLLSNGAVFGYGSRVSNDNNLIHLSRSSANSTSNFTNAISGFLIGSESRARTTLFSVDNINYSTIMPQFAHVAATGAIINMAYGGSNNTVADDTFQGVSSDIESYFSDRTRTIRSYSNEVVAASKSADMQISLYSPTYLTSPAIDDIKSDMIVFENIISSNSSLVDEIKPGGGNTQAKYISKRISLADEQDAEDLQVFLSAYRPSNTDVTVFAKFLNADDSVNIDTKWWTPLSQSTPQAVVSSRIDRNDFKEFIYEIPKKRSINATSAASLSDYSIYSTFQSNGISSNTITTSNTTPLEPGSLVYYVGTNANGISNGFYNILQSNTTSTKLATAGTTTQVGISNVGISNTDPDTLYSVPLTAFTDTSQGNVVSYYTSTGALFYTYKTFAIKIAMTSQEGSHLVPRVSDMRAIALQI